MKSDSNYLNLARYKFIHFLYSNFAVKFVHFSRTCCIIFSIWIICKGGKATVSIALEERTTGHATYSNIERVIQILDVIDSSNISTNQLEMLGRIRLTFDFLKEALDRVDPWLVSTNTMNSINSPISQVLNEINNFNNNRNEGHLTNCLSNIETLLQYFPQILVTKTPEEIEGVRSSVVTFRKSVGQYLSHLEKDINETRTSFNKNTEKLNELTTSVESQKSRIDPIINEFQNQFSQAQGQKTEAFNDFIKKAEADFKGLCDSNTQTFDQIVETQQKSFDTLNEGFEKQVETQQKSFETLIEEMKAEFLGEIDHLREMNKEAEKILGIVSMKGLARGYQKIANSEGWKALCWNIFSILSLLGILWFGYEFIIKHEGVMEWTALISRIVLTGVGLTLFTYCAKQATNHRNEERRNRKIELELASLDPYIKDFEPEEQKSVKENLVEKYFGVEFPTPNVKETSIQQQNISNIITNNPQLIQTLVEKITPLITKQ